ncbi:MAG: deoxyguanosinetriphosphate triphosphohydrolase [Acidobacteria bacterium]|nr:deoxyguanosinetriphosphate triphosphohydrolase [Acidobacteriota bacterium]
MLTRDEWETFEATHLAPWAMQSARSRGRRYPEDEHPFRTCFQRDRDRIIHCSSFRRLEYKTQVFVNHEGDHYRTRLTHTLEASQISRTIARALRLNEDLTEAITLAHDLGHTPFGHAGEDIMKDLMRDHGGFEHNRQSLRILDTLERRYPDFPGLNLTWEVREAIIKHSPGREKLADPEYDPDCSPCLESQLIDFADEIAYINHDCDDGLAGGILDLNGLDSVSLWGGIWRGLEERYPAADEQLLRYQTVRGMINQLCTDLIGETLRRLRDCSADIAVVRSRPDRLVAFSDGMLGRKNELKDYLLEKLYRHYRVVRMADKARRILTDLFETFVSNPRQLPPNIQARLPQDGPHRVVCDYIAGMTDRYALDEHKRLFDPHERV